MDDQRPDPTQPTDPAPTAYGSARTAAGPTPAPWRFRRSRSDRMLAGVCGGLADTFAVDPVVIRVLLGVLTFFGGAGLVIYGVCWLLMPDDDRDISWAEQALRRDGGSHWPALALAAILGVAALITTGALFDHRAGVLIALVVVAAILLARRQDRPPPPWSPPPITPAKAWATTAPSAPDGWAPLPPLAPPAPREHSILGRLTLGVILLALGLLAAADLAWADVPAAAYPVVVLAGSGAGLLLGTWYGRARSLIALGLVGGLALPVAVFADTFDGDWADRERTIAPADATGIAPEYSYRAGRIHLDLRNVDFTGRDVSTEVRLGAGDLEVTVPANTDVRTEIDLGAGEATFFGAHSSGLCISKDRADDGADGPGGGTLYLTVSQGFGRVEVLRAAA